MKREIKFRAKTLSTNEWVFGDLHLLTKFPHIHDGEVSKSSIQPDTVGQFTGLTDKKGREIYEGDVLRINNGAVICLLVVTWNAEVGSWCLRFKEELKEGTRPLGRWLCDRDYDIELTGNIYDNKELLEE